MTADGSLGDAEQLVRVEALLRLRDGDAAPAQHLVDLGQLTVEELIHDLRVHQAELEMQSHELREAVRRSEIAVWRFRRLFDLLPHPSIVVDRYGTVVDCNAAADQVFGFEDRSRLPKPTLRRVLATPTMSRVVASALVEAAKDGRSVLRDIGVVTTDGAVRRADLSIERFVQQEAHVDDQFLVLVVDETERLEATERFRLVTESVEDVCWLVNADHTDVLYVSPSYRDVWGRDPGELRNRPRAWLTAVHPEDRQRVMHALETQPRHFDLRYRLLRSDGTVVWISDRAVPAVPGYDRSDRIARVSRDITELHEAEAHLHSVQRMESLGQLTGGIAHDFNNLLTVVLGYAEVLGKSPDLDAGAAGMLEAIRTSAQRGADLTRRLLAFARRQPLAPRATDANELILSSLDLLRRAVGEHVAIDVDLRRDTEPCLIDGGQLESALLNLVANAGDALPGGGTITIRTSGVQLEADQAEALELSPGWYTTISVHDDGSGMDPVTMSHAFEPFFTTKDIGHGTGLGLAMVYGFAKQSNGSIDIRSEEGVGTTVTLYLPVSLPTTSPVAPARPSTVDTHDGRGRRVLLVEDEPDVRAYERLQLELLGYVVAEAADGATALRLLEELPEIDLLMTDVLLPGAIGGQRLAERARASRPSLPVLFVSGYTERSLIHQGQLDPDVYLLQKPFTASELTAGLDAALGRLSDRP